MKPFLIGLLILTVAMANSQGTTNMHENTEEYLNSGEPIKVKTGLRFTIRMESNPTTGYSWQLSKPLDQTVVQCVTNIYEAPDSKLMGAGGHEVWTFMAVGQGQAVISMQYVRPWEKEKPPVKTQVFNVIVK